MRFTPYLNFNGQCEEAFRFYEQTFGGKILAMFPFRGTPAEEHVPAEIQDKIMHACLQVGNALLMASDGCGDSHVKPQGLQVSIHVEDPAEAERIFTALAEGGTVTMPIQETFWAARFGMTTDRFGTPWMINCEKAAVS